MDIQKIVQLYCDWIDFCAMSTKLWTRAVWLNETPKQHGRDLNPKLWDSYSKIWNLYS